MAFAFTDLNEYVLVNLVAYLPLADQVRFERLDSRFRAVTAMQWSSVKVIDDEKLIDLRVQLDKRYGSSETICDAIMAVFLRCKNVKHLCLRFMLETKSDINELSKKMIACCPSLESFCAGSQITHAEHRSAKLARRYLKYNKNNVVKRLTFDLSSTKVAQIAKLVKMTPRLEQLYISFRIRHADDSPKFRARIATLLAPIGAQLQRLMLYNVKDAMLNVFIDHCPNLKLLYLKDTYSIDERTLERVASTMTGLTDVDIEMPLGDMRALTSLQHLKQISWMDRSPYEERHTQQAAMSLFKKAGVRLESMGLYLPNSARIGEDNFARLPAHCPNVQQLCFSVLNEGPNDSKLFTTLLTGFKNLRCVSIAGVKFAEEDIALIFQHCTKLRSIGMCRPQPEGFDDVFIREVKNFAERHPLRPITASIGFRTQYESPDDVTLQFYRATLIMNANRSAAADPENNANVQVQEQGAPNVAENETNADGDDRL